MTEKRSDTRTAFRAGVRITHATAGEYILKTRDMSHTGAFLILRDEIGLELNDKITIQSTDIDDAPMIDAEIVRIESDGFAVRYLVD
jgi:c-di-GMP-binding flagellar brake protein YcgR